MLSTISPRFSSLKPFTNVTVNSYAPMDEQFSFIIRIRPPTAIQDTLETGSGRQRYLDLKLIILGDYLLPTTSILGDSRKLTSLTCLTKAMVPASYAY